jgi:threonyl-tRNA synthetase
MPDLHTLAADEAQARAEFLDQVDLCLEVLAALELETQISVRFVRDFWERDPSFAAEIARRVDRPVLVERWEERFFYFTCKFEANFVDSQDKAACLSTVQIDVENTERFDITYVGPDGQSHHPLLLHTSASGSIDRVLYAILETQAMRMQRSEKAHWPFWLAPTQVRVVPISEEQVPAALELVARLPGRADVDDRDEKLGRKIRDAEKEWVPVIAVLGAREAASGTVSVRLRSGEQLTATVEELGQRLAEMQAGMPTADLNQPVRLTERPLFVG